MFSPYYAWARRRGIGEPTNHCALNVALYGAGGKRWAMTERGRNGLHQETSALGIGPSDMAWDGTALTIGIDEVTVPFPSRIRGRVRLYPEAITDHVVTLDVAGRHRWWPVAPCARVEVELDQPGLRWSGRGYLDSNRGDAPLERDFTTWDWSRAATSRGTAILYDTHRREGGRLSVGLLCAPSGKVEAFTPPPLVALPRTSWRVARGTQVDIGHEASVIETLENTPFYARSLLRSHLLDEPVTAVHESLSLDRFSAPVVQLMLPFRMPRRSR